MTATQPITRDMPPHRGTRFRPAVEPARAPSIDAGKSRPSPAIMFVSGRCLFPYSAMLDLMLCWAQGRRNEFHIVSRVDEARSELMRGARRADVVRSLMHLFDGFPAATVSAATQRYLWRMGTASPRPDLQLLLASASNAGTETTLLSDLPLAGSVDHCRVDSLVCSTLEFRDERLTGEIEMISETAERGRAVAGRAAARGIESADCSFVHLGHREDSGIVETMANSVDLRRRRPIVDMHAGG